MLHGLAQQGHGSMLFSLACLDACHVVGGQSGLRVVQAEDAALNFEGWLEQSLGTGIDRLCEPPPVPCQGEAVSFRRRAEFCSQNLRPCHSELPAVEAIRATDACGSGVAGRERQIMVQGGASSPSMTGTGDPPLIYLQ